MKDVAASAEGEGTAAATTSASPPITTSSPSSLLPFGALLYEEYLRLPEERAAFLPPTRYADYLHHFGFCIERESVGVSASLPEVPHDSRHAERKAHVPANARSVAGAEADGPHRPVAHAGWGLPEAFKREADERCMAVGSLRGVTTYAAFAEQLVEPFKAVTWRQTSTECAVKIARCIYAWLCTNMTLAAKAAVLAEEAAEESVRAAAIVRPPAQQKSAARKSTRSSQKSKEAPTVEEPEVPVDPLVAALQSRRASPQLLAKLYMTMMSTVGVSCEVVEGQLKGVAPEESFEWSWNMVSLEGQQYLVDVAAALSNGVLRDVPPTSSPAPVEATAGGAKPQKGISGQGRGNPSAAPVPPAEGTNRFDDDDVVRMRSTTPATLRRDFFFFAHPSHFLCSHLPTDSVKALVTTPIKALQWGVQPSLTPAFYHYGLQLSSHQARSAFVASSTPAYLSLVNRDAGRTELCCVVYEGTLRSLPEDLTQTKPLGAEWVWHQREETTDTHTFTLTVPQAGFYVVVVGARPIRADPYSAFITVPEEEAFTPVVRYEMRVGFTPTSSPVLPRQFLSPSLCRLMSPLSAQLAPGRHIFRVMPSCSNVLAAAVVRLTPTTGLRTLVSFLPFEPRRAVFEGPAEVRGGEVVEVWILYGAPDRNGQQLGQRTAALPSVEPAALLSRLASADVPRTKAMDKKKKGEAAAELRRHTIEEARRTQLTQARCRGEVFLRLVGGMEVRHFVSPSMLSIIQPQPTVEQERGMVLRRLAGVTAPLLTEAAQTARHQPVPVGGYFAAVPTATKT